MSKLLDDHIFSPTMRYEGHRLHIRYQEEEEELVFGGFFGAVLMAAQLVDTAEGDARGIALSDEEEQAILFKRYEREVLHDDWGYLEAEAAQLNDAYIQLSTSSITIQQLIPNKRLWDLVMRLVVRYMEQLVREVFGEHVWEFKPWTGPFAQWLYDASYAESYRQRYINTDWIDAVAVNSIVEVREEPKPVLYFEGEDANAILSRYFEWLSTEFAAMKREEPDAAITAADRHYILSNETDYAYLEPEIAKMDAESQQAFRRWMEAWSAFITAQLRPQEEIRFWKQEVPEELREKLLNYLRLQEKQPLHYKALTSAVYALRQLGYIPYKLGMRTMRQWLSEHLAENYMLRTKASQFNRAWKELGRYTESVREQVEVLEDYGIKKL